MPLLASFVSLILLCTSSDTGLCDNEDLFVGICLLCLSLLSLFLLSLSPIIIGPTLANSMGSDKREKDGAL